MRPLGVCSNLNVKLSDFFNESLPLNERLKRGHELCDGLENAVADKDMQDLTMNIYEKVQKLLTSTEPQNLQECATQKLRRLCLEILQKLPNGDHLRPYARSILSLLFKLVEIENEDNVLICVKLIIDLHKYYRPSFSSDVTCFLSFVRRVYRGLRNETVTMFEPQHKIEVSSIADLNLAATVQKAFTVTPVYTQEPESDGSFKTYHILPKSSFSLKVMQEIPILVVLMYQLFKQHIHQDVSEFIPLIMDFINLHPTEQQKSNAAFSQDIFIDFMAAQVKTLSFLAYVIKIYQDLVEHYSGSLVQGMMNLLINCPPSVTNMRKEFFIAARHILSAQEIRPKFLDVLDDLMNEDILIGQGYTVRDALRPLAYSTLADLTHHIRGELSLAKIARALDLYGRNMHDDTLPFSIQQMSLRLLLNLVECVRQRVLASLSNPTGSDTTDELNTGVASGTARRLLLHTLRLCVLKCRIVAEHYLPILEATCIPESPDDSDASAAKQRSVTPFLHSTFTSQSASEQMESSMTFEKPTSSLLKTTKSGIEDGKNKTSTCRVNESIASKPQLSHLDLRSLIKALMAGMRTIVTGMIQCPHEPGFGASISGSSSGSLGTKLSKSTASSAVASSAIATRFLTPDELMVLTDYFNYGMRMIDVVQIVSRDGRLYTKGQPSSKSPDERLLIETFALTFAQLSPVSFQEIFSSKISDFVLWCRRSPSYTNMALHLLSQLNKTSCFGHILLSYLVDRLERLGDGTDESVLYMRLLKLCFSSVNVAGTENEHVMKLHLRRIVQGSMQYCLTAEEPTAYLTLLRTLFRSIGGGAHDKLYREFFPLLPEMLSTLNRLLRSPHRANARDLLGELCVIVPVRLSTLLPYLSLLMEPLVYVLNCNTVNQGLRTLELCVDNMQPDFLHDHLHQVRGDMLLALYNSLHSSSEYVQKMSFKVLGKLGRFNRTNLLEVQRLRLDPGENESGPRLRFYLNEFRTQPIDLPVRSLVDAAFEVLQDVNVDLPTKTRAWELLQSVCLGAFDLLGVGLDNNRTSSSTDCSFYAHIEGSEFLAAVRHFVTVANNEDGVNIRSDRLLMQSTCCVDGDLDRDVMIRSLAGLFLAAYTKPLRDSHADFIGFIVRHLTILSITQLVQYSLHSLDSDQNDGAQPGKDQNLNAPSSKSSYPTTCQTKLIEPGLNLVLPVHERYRVCHEAGTPTLAQMTSGDKLMNRPTLNPVLLVDAIQMIMGHEEKQLTRPMSVLLQNVHSTATAVIRGAHDASHEPCTIGEEQVQKAVAQLPLFIHLGHVLIDMLHHPSWYVKWGGCATIIYLVGILHPIWFQSHFLSLLHGLMHCIHDLSSQMSQGALKMARECSRLLIQTVFTSRASTLPCVSESAGTEEGGLKMSDAPAEDDDTSGRPTSGKRSTMATRRRPPVSGNGSQARRTGSLRRGRSASISSNTSINEPEDEANVCTMDVAGEETGPSVTKSDLTCTAPPKQPDSKFVASLLTSTIRSLLDALLSETAAVREEARCLLRLLSHQLGRPLSVLLAPHWRPLLGHILPPQPPLRLPDLPVSTQLVVLEANYFFGQSEAGRNKSRTGVGASSGTPAPFDVQVGGADLLRYDVARKADRLFLIDVRALLTQADQGSNTAADSNAGTATPTTSASSIITSGQNTASGGSSSQLGGTRQAGFGSRATCPPAVHRPKSTDLRVAACRVLSLTHYLTAQKLQNLSTLFKGICSDQDVIHEEAFACLKEFVSHTSIDIELRHANVKPILQNVRQTTHLRLNTARQLSYCAQLFPSTFSERLCDAIYSHLTALVDNLRNQQNVSSILTLVPPNLELCAVLMDLFHMIPLATAKHVSCLIDLVVRAERSLNIEPTSPLRLPLVRFLARYPAETCMHLLTGSKWPYDALAHRIFLYVLKSPQGQAITDYLKTNYHILCDLIRPTDLADQKLSSTTSARYWLPRIGTPLTAACPRHLAIRAVHVIHQLFPNWLLHNPSISDESPRSSKSRYKAMCSSPTGSTGKTNSAKTTYHPVCSALLAYWRSDVFAKRQASLTLVTLSTVPSDLLPEAAADCSTSGGGLLCGLEYVESEGMMNPIDPSTDSITGAPEFTLPSGEPIPMIASGTGHFEHWDEPRLILDCLLDCAKADVENFDLLFVLVIGVNRLRSVAGLYPLRCFLDGWIKEAPLGWHRRLFLHYISLVRHRLSAMADASIMADPSMVVFGGNLSITVEDMYRLMAHLILPSFAYALECGPLDELIGGPANPLEENENDLVYLFIHVLLDDPALHVCTELRVMYYQLACLFVHFATDYIHSAPETEHSPRLRRLIDFAWCCTTSSLSVVDLQEKYTGLQLLAYLIAKFQLSPKIAVQVFQCLAKGTHTETKKIVNPALDVLIPAWVRSPSDQQVLASTTRKIILEDHGIQSCIHIIGIIVRHADLYYPIRHQLLPHIIIIISRLANQQLPVEQRRLALDMIDTAAQWDHRCRQLLNEVQVSESSIISLATPFTEELMDIHADDDSSAQTTSHTANTTSVGSAGILTPHPTPTSCSNQSENTPMSKTHRDQLLNLMVRFACQAVDSSQNGSLSEASVTRALSQLEFALRSDVWGGETCELRLSFIDRHLASEESVGGGVQSNSQVVTPSGASGGTSSSTSGQSAGHPGGPGTGTASATPGVAQSTTHPGAPGLGTAQTNHMLMTLEVLRVLFTSLESPTLLSNVKHFSGGLCSLLTRQLTNVRLIRSCANLLRAMLERFPADASHRQKITTHAELFDIYSTTSKTIQESFSLYSENGPKSTLLARLQSAFLLFQATQVHINPHAFVDRCIVQLVKLTHRLIQDVISPSFGSNAQDSGAGSQLTELLITSLEVIKSRLNVVSHEMRKNAFGPDLCLIMDRARDPRLFRTVIKILRDWINVPKSEEHFAPTAREKVSFFHRLWLAYPRWVDSTPDIAREILECVFEVYSSGNLFKNHDLYVKLEQAFCCSMLCPFPDIRERFIALYLDASQLYSIQSSTAVASAQSNDCKSATQLSGMETLDSTNNSVGAGAGGGGVDPYESTSSSPAHHADTDRDSASSAQGSDSQQSQLRAATTSSSLLVRLLFLFVSSNWDENHFRDEFWLPLFFDVLLCDVDTSLPPVLSTGSSLFPTLTGSRNSNPVGSTPEQKPSTSEFSRLVEWQIKGCKEYTAITFKEGLRGLLCLIHRHPALATQLMSQLWPQIWNRLLLRQPETCTNSVPDSGSGGCATAGTSLSVCSEQPRFSEHNSEELFRSGTTNVPEHKAAAGLDPMSSAVGFVGSNANNHSGPGCFSVNEIRGFVIPQLWRFLTSDQHVNPSEPQPSALGAFLSCLATTPDTVLMHVPLPAITYIGTAYNQWHSVALFLESVCCRARKHGSDQTIPLNDFVFNVSLPTPESDTGGSFTVAPIQPSKMPTGSANLSLIALYDSMNEPDYLASAWWYRLTPFVRPQNAQGATRRQTGMLKCLEYAQHGLLLRSLECSLDQLAATTGASGLGSFDSTSGSGVGLTGIGGGGSASSNRAAAVAASTASAVVRSQNASPLTLAGASNQLSDYVNRARLQDYCIRYLKQLGQWDSLETLASNMQTGSYMSTPFGAVNAGSCGNTGSGSTGGPGASLGSSCGSAYWGLKADAAWRRSDWPEVYASLSRLANEAPRIDLCRYALIHGVACVAGRRTSSGFAAAVAAAQATVSSGISSSDSDPYGTGSIGESGSSACNTGASGSSQTPNASGAGAAASAASGSPMSTSGSSSTGNATVNSVVSIIQASEAESHRIMSTVLREWRRMPLIITTQHVPLLQIAHRAVEVTEGNSLLAQYCGHVLSGPCLNQSMSAGSGSSTSGVSTSGAGSSAVSSAALRMPLSQALHDYKTVFKWWQSRPPSIGDDLGFWHDLFSWRQVVEESIITYHPYLQKFGPERANLIAMCERELALSQLQLARGARKCRFPSIAQQHLDRYTRMNLPPLFEKTKQEIKLKMAELRKDELLEGLELMEKTNIQQYEKKDRAKFFCYKAVFFSHFNKGDEATKNFGYATQMQDNIHKVWSIYGDFLENVYSSYPAAKREVAVSTTGIFAMQALMEAASVAGGQERRSRADLAKCLWLLTLDDDTKGQQRLARTFEERASRVRPDAFLPWLPSLVVSLLRPEGRFIVPALRGVTATHPTVLYNLLRGLQHQLTTEVLYDERLSELARTASSEPAGSYAHLLQTRIRAARGSRMEDSGRKLSRVGAGSRDEQGRAGAAPLDVPARGSGEFTLPRGSAGVTGPNVASTSSGGGGLATYSTVSPANSKKKKRVIVVMRGVEGDRLSGGSPLSPDQQQSQSLQSRPQAKKFNRDPGDNLHGDAEDEVSDGKTSASKKSVVVVTSASDTDSASSSTRDPRGRIGVTSESTQPDDTEDPDGAEEEEEDEEDTEDGEIDRDEMNGTGAVASSGIAGGSVSSSPASALPADARAKTSGNGLHDADGVGVTGVDQGTGCLSFSVTDGLHRINLLMGQIRRHHAARIYAVDLFTAEIGGRLQPSWAEQLLTRLCSLLDYLQRLAWAGVFSGKHWHPRSVEKLRVPDWLLLELRIQLSAACGSSIRVASVTRSGWARLSELGHSASSAAESLPHIPGSQARKRTSSASSTSLSSSSSSSSESDKEERSKKPIRAGRKQQLVGRDATKSKTEPSSVDSGSKFIREKLGSTMNQSSTKRALPADTNRYVHRSSLRQTSAFSEVTQIAAETARREADRDPWFMRTHRQLLKAVDDWENRSILYVMQRLTRHWIPLLEQRVACLPTRMLLSDYGAHRLIELPNLVVAVQSNSSTGPNVSGGTNSAMTSIPVGTNIVLPSVPCLELPGESGLLQSTGGFLNSSSFPYSTSQGSTTASVGPNLALHLVIAEVFPHVSRVRCSPGRLACPARRLGIRASNGRVFYYDLPALGIVPPISYSSSPALASAMSVQLNASAGARTRSLMQARTRSWNMGPLTLDGLCPEPYTGWRHTGPLHLFQMINDMLAGQPETAKRRLALFTPRVMEVGPMGLCLTETSASTPAASVGIASAHPLPSANPVTARGLTALARPPPVTGAGGGLGPWIGSEWMSKPKSSGPALPDWAVPFSQWDNVDTSTGVRDTRSTNKIKTTLPTPPPGPLPALVSPPNTSLSSNLSVGGSAAVAAEAIGRPCGLDAGCHPTCTSLTGVLDQACASWYQSHKVPKPSAERPFDASTRTADEAALYAGTRELVCLFYESLISSVSNPQQQSGKVTIPTLCQLFHNLSQRLPQSPWVKNALISALGSLPDADCSADSTSYTESSVEFPRGNLLRNWAANRMLDAESYWLFRHNLASHLALIGLTEQLFHLTPTHPACLVMDPRSGRAESRHVLFNLPTWSTCAPLFAGRAAEATALGSTNLSQISSLTTCFATVMGLCSPKVLSLPTDGKTSTHGRSSDSSDTLLSSTDDTGKSPSWTHYPSPVPFRLTPHLAGFICLPGAPASVGPFAVSLTTAAQAFASAQRPNHALSTLYRTMLRADYILWHRGRQAAVHAFHLLFGSDSGSTNPQLTGDSMDSDSDTDTEAGGHRRKTKLFNELGVKAVDSIRGDKGGSIAHVLSSSQQQQQQVQQQQKQLTSVQRQKSAGRDCVLLPDLTNEQLIQLITLTLDVMNTNLKGISDYSSTEPGTWNSIAAATNPSSLIQMDPAYLPWL